VNATGRPNATKAAMTTAPGSPSHPIAYAWEATDQQVSERYGVPLDQVVRFDLNTSPAPPDFALPFLAAGEFGRPISEYPPSDYGDLVAAAARVYGVGQGEILIGAGADEILDLVAKAFLAPGATAVIPEPTYSMYRVLTEQRPARPVSVARRPAGDGFGLDVPAVRAAARGAAMVWLCSPNNPTALLEPAGVVEMLLSGLADDADTDGTIAPVVVLDEAYAEFAGRSLVGLRAAYPRLIVVRTASKAYALAGMRVGFALARREVIAAIEPYRPPGSVSIPSVALVTAALQRPDVVGATVARVTAERERLASGLAAAGIPALPSVTNFLLVPLGSPERARALASGLLWRGLVPRTFDADHPLADHLRFTVRSAEEDGLLLAALAELVPSLPVSSSPDPSPTDPPSPEPAP
jgi:histidinol-phosphate aminotransferase